MKLAFEGRAVVELKSGGIKFAGYWVDQSGHSRDVICRISREALSALRGLTDPSDAELLAAYHAGSQLVNNLASVQFSAGIEKPNVTLHDVPRDWCNPRIASESLSVRQV